MLTAVPIDPAQDPDQPTRPAVTWRSILLGLAGVTLIALITPYNNYVVNNTDLIGNVLPTSVVLMTLVVVLVNALARRWRPMSALSRGELTVALAMVLVGCAFPAVGLMRYLPGHLVAPWYHASVENEVRDVLNRMHLPDWLFPDFAEGVTDAAARGNDPVVTNFIGRVPLENATFLDRAMAVPWRAWLRPGVTWGIFIAALFGAVVCLTVIFREQWVVAERLPFPLASVWMSLIEPPERGRTFNELFRAKSFWIGCGAVVLIDLVSGLSKYFPEVPAIPLKFDLYTLLSEGPWAYASGDLKMQTIFFTIIGITYCMQTKVALSLWVTYVAVQVIRMFCGTRSVEITPAMTYDQVGGATLVFFVMIVWLARRHLASIVLQMFRGRRAGEPQGWYLSRGVAGWAFVACVVASIAWLVLAGASLVGAASIVAMLMVIYVVLAKVIAETGLLYVLIPYQINRAWIYALRDLPGAGVRTTLPSYYFASMFSGMLLHDLRQNIAPLASHALRIGDGDASVVRQSRRFFMWLIAAMLLAYVVSGVSTLYVHYNYAVSLDTQGLPLDNNGWSWQRMPRAIGLSGALAYAPPNNGPTEPHNRLAFFGLGAAITAILSFLHLRFTSFPLHPVGYLLVWTWGIDKTWFSIFIGWLCKVVVVRLGGSQLLTTLRPLFIGLIVGEATAATIWLIVSLILAQLGMEYHAVQLLP
jgi:hypothetical protein